MADQKPKKPCQSAVTTRYLLMPHHANPHGTAFGGTIMSWIDTVASMAAQRHARTEVVTASIDQIQFRQPINIGDHVLLKASVNYVGRTSMEVGVKVTKENPYTGNSTVATTAHLTFVALDEKHRPTVIPPLEPATDDEKRRFANAQKRLEQRKTEITKKGE
ncbi:putative acyl-CoA thioester hydrolase [Anaerohalosphaera lusitana]|uniref:Putative acyl-CoA thioester hydrolase n=1 Tax=Anaerohalosphaera lusitana TaxID=1936003 RepID=A0A1U9NIV2_9BACT|nr:acyl-CoA thioesterase [Anaerohalosphaera lusitana]AQT67717.1 putative acyl-CoA thioester hydrolase [Anaerohalosphaera lusitana]